MKLFHIKRESLDNVHTRALLSIRWDGDGWEVVVMCPVPFSRKLRACDFGRIQKMTTLAAFAGVMRSKVSWRQPGWYRCVGLEVVGAETERDCYTL